jgi:hypothetical protein
VTAHDFKEAGVVRRALPGKIPDYVAYYRNDVSPGLQKAKASGKIAGATIAIRGAGAPSGYYDKFADLDTGDPLVQALGTEAAQATNTQVIVRRRLADLSF